MKILALFLVTLSISSIALCKNNEKLHNSKDTASKVQNNNDSYAESYGNGVLPPTAVMIIFFKN
jgi:hypothetical protein